MGVSCGSAPFGKQIFERLDAAGGGAGLLDKDVAGAGAHDGGGEGVVEQVNEGLGQLIRRGDAEGVVGQEIFCNGAEVGVVWAHDDRDAELGGLERVVSAGGDEAATDEGHGGKGIHGCEFADRVEEDDLAREDRGARAGWFGGPGGTLGPR